VARSGTGRGGAPSFSACERENATRRECHGVQRLLLRGWGGRGERFGALQRPMLPLLLSAAAALDRTAKVATARCRCDVRGSKHAAGQQIFRLRTTCNRATTGQRATCGRRASQEVWGEHNVLGAHGAAVQRGEAPLVTEAAQRCTAESDAPSVPRRWSGLHWVALPGEGTCSDDAEARTPKLRRFCV